jgi:chemotaxis protein methyltransferase CheR
VSPSECSQGLFTGFAAVNLPGTILYRKRLAHEPAQIEAPELLPEFSPSLSQTAVETLLETPIIAAPLDMPVPPEDPHAALLVDARAAYAEGRYAECATQLLAALEPGANDARLLALHAHALANQGDLDAALAAAERWIAADKLDSAGHYLHAMVLQELGQRLPARLALQRAVYLQPDFTLAHFALGNVARAEARHDEARRHFANTAQLLRGHAAEEVVPESEGLNVGRLREIIAALMRGGDA